mgnify:CR=1 FL=1
MNTRPQASSTPGKNNQAHTALMPQHAYAQVRDKGAGDR